VRRFAAAAVLLAGCATSSRARTPESTLISSEVLEMRFAHDELRRLDASLSNADLQTSAPDCAQITQLRDNICDLATRICKIEGRQPDGSTEASQGAWYCLDGSMRCKRANERAQARGCPTKK